MSKPIEKRFYVCPNCDTAYPEKSEAEACIRNHPFPKKMWIEWPLSMDEDYAKHLFHEVLGRREWYCPYPEWEDELLGENFHEALCITEMLIEVNDSPSWVHILEMKPLFGLELGERYKVSISSDKDTNNEERKDND